MSSSYALGTYTNRDLSIEMRTSSGDVITFDMARSRSMEMSGYQNGGTSQSSYSLRSVQTFNFSVTTNGLDAQDRKELAEFMKIARPYIVEFMNGLERGNNSVPRNKTAQHVAEAFAPWRERDGDAPNHAKNGIVELFDNALAESRKVAKIFDDVTKLLERTLKYFDALPRFKYA